ncbi:hypothetical protein ACFW7L_00835, partial [Streptomyces pharetrae]
EGKAEGKAESLLAVLEARGLFVSEEVRRRVLGCADLGLLDEWLVRAVRVERAGDLFGDGVVGSA